MVVHIEFSSSYLSLRIRTINTNDHKNLKKMAEKNSDRTSSENKKVTDLTLSAIKDFILSKSGKVRYAELFDHFRNLIVDSSSGFLILF